MNNTDEPHDGATAGSILREAAGIVEGQRQRTHGAKERSFSVIADLWMCYLGGRRYASGCYLNAFDVANMMTLLKMARAVQGEFVRDHAVDACGYASIAGEIALENPDIFKGAAPPRDITSKDFATTLETISSQEAEIKRLIALNTDAEERLEYARAAFDSYAQHHFAKDPPDNVKAQRNGNLAGMCRGHAVLGFSERPGMPPIARQKATRAAAAPGAAIKTMMDGDDPL